MREYFHNYDIHNYDKVRNFSKKNDVWNKFQNIFVIYLINFIKIREVLDIRI